MSDDISQRLKTVRDHFRASGTQMSEICGLKDRKTWSRYEVGDTRPHSDMLAALHGRGIDINWLLTGQGTMLRSDGAMVAGAVPVVGLAECGLKGWYQSAATGLFAAAPPAVAADPQGLAVIAIGESMRPAGIRPGDLVFCQSGDAPQEGDSVLVELIDGAKSLKRWTSAAGGWIALQGWLPADPGGVQMPYTDQRRADQIRRILPVALVQAGMADHLMPPGAMDGYGPDDRLYHIAIKAGLRWVQTSGLEVKPDGLAAMVTRAVRMLRSQGGGAIKTDAELADDVGNILDMARAMLASVGWIPK